ncbi:MAG: HDOD domain-containing protein [Hydrogenophaga sp.]|uniref:HDOD domain-containing protein n=1 Tax=Hydrogenophaga sp. TaxID=1904254 RepID=UPI00262991B6|nr:HDOD domain-containing protein [Hydrogenophaga sp.]MDM7942015.1 HDOD domain-containing protein [Hydrogenophaga sp.]
MKTWLLRLFNGPAPALAPPVEAPTVPMDQRPAVEDWQSRRRMLDDALLAWMTQCEPAPSGSLGDAERQVLQRLTARVADTASHASLLPRAAGVVPALLARLRSESSSLRELTEHVSRDPALVAEVVTMANSAFYRRERPVMELSHSIQMLGEGGLRAAIARVVLKPMLDGRSGPLVKRSAPRLWQHTEFKTQLGAEIAHSQGRDPFDAYLLALLHDMAWTVVLRELDDVAGWHLSAPFVTELGRWRDRLAALIAQQWRPHGPWVQAAVELAQHGVGADSGPAVQDLFAADELAWLLCNPDRARARALAEPLLFAAHPAVRACYEDLDPTAAARD